MTLLQDLLEIHMKPKASWFKDSYAHSQAHAGKRPPLRSFRELADDYGVTLSKLSTLFASHHGPAAKLKSNGIAQRNSYYDPAEVRAWWDKLPANVKQTTAS